MSFTYNSKIAKQCNIPDDEYQDFCNTVIIYNGPTVKKSTVIITINRDGCLNSPFQDGFLSYTSDLVMGLLKWKALHQ